MFGMGTIINVAAILAAGVIGMIGGKWLTARCQESITRAMGICVLFIAIGGVMEQMLVIQDGKLSTQGSMMLVISVSLGCLIGEILDLDGKIERFGCWLREKSGNGQDGMFLDGFVTATLTVCIGAMAIVGSVKDGIYGDYTILATKSLLDFVIIIVMTSSMGKGCMFSAIPVAIFQGTFTILGRLIEPFLTEAALANLSLVGSALIFCVGANLIWKNLIRVANLLPALVIAVAYALLGF